MNIAKIEAIEAEIRDATIALLASEGWAKGWHDQPEAFKLLLANEAAMERLFRDYFRSLAQRIGSYINWSKYHLDTIAVQASERPVKTLEAYDVSLLFDTDGFEEDEQTQLEGLIREIYINGVAIGYAAGLARAADRAFEPIRQTVESPIFTAIQEAAAEHIRQLAEWLDTTTAKRVVQAIQESIALGESVELATKRIMDEIGDITGERSALIARTESVRAFAIGENKFALRNGATQKYWQALPGADAGGSLTPCLDNDGVTVDILDAFPSGDEMEPAHPNCRCRVDYIYPDGSVVEDV